jgi:hypothetical protein
MMENIRFDTLVRVLAARRPRRAALPLLAVLGLRLTDTGQVGTAKAKDEKEIRICVCADANPSTCKTQKNEKDKAKKTLRRNACAYRGRCTGVSGCAGSLTSPSAGPVCPAVCPHCEVCNPATGQCGACPARCTICLSLAERRTLCGKGGIGFTCTNCATSADCTDPLYPNCLVAQTDVVTNRTVLVQELPDAIQCPNDITTGLCVITPNPQCP